MVRAVALLVLGQLAYAPGDHLARPHRGHLRLPQSLAADQPLRLLCLLPLLRVILERFLQLPIGQHASPKRASSHSSSRRPAYAPRLGREAYPPIRACYFLLLWEWFRIYFESGLVKVLSGDPQWRHLTALDDYYQNGPLPSWVGWYVAHLPHWFHVTTTGGTLLIEFVVVLMLFFPRRARIVCFCIVTLWQIGIILTANYTFLNYLVLALGFLLLDDKLLRRFVPARFGLPASAHPVAGDPALNTDDEASPEPPSILLHLRSLGLAIAAVFLTWIGYATTAELVGMVLRPNPLPMAPVEALEPFRIANEYGLFAVMTRGRYEIEFQGSNDNQNWTPYPFRYKPQALSERPGLYAPYQPRFDWNLWFASLGDWRQNQIVPLTEEHLLANDASVLHLFRGNPFPNSPPRYVRAVLWQYWFTSIGQKRRTGELVAAQPAQSIRANPDLRRQRQDRGYRRAGRVVAPRIATTPDQIRSWHSDMVLLHHP